MLNQKMVDLLFPLLKKQTYINLIEPYDYQPFHIDLDVFRAGIFPLDRENIARWCGYITRINADLWLPWLSVTLRKEFSQPILLARSGRYQNTKLYFAFLNEYKNLNL